MSEMTYKKLSVSELCDRLEIYSSYKLLMHSSPDGDTFGSCTALSLLLSEMGKTSYIVYPDKVFPEHLLPFKTLPVYSPAEAVGIECDAVVTVDVASPVQLRDNYETYKDQICLMIDHHDNGTPMADNLICPDACAVGEIVYEIAQELIARGRVEKMSLEVAEAIYLSITSDTGCFKYSNAKPKTHRYAASLIEIGVRSAYINMMCFDSKSPEQIEAEKITYNNLHILLGGKLVIAALDTKTKQGLKNEYFENAVNIARSVKGALVSCSLKEKEEIPGDFRVSLRSGPSGVDVSKICAQFGGGGHVCAAGCSITAPSIDKAIEIICEKVSEVLPL